MLMLQGSNQILRYQSDSHFTITENFDSRTQWPQCQQVIRDQQGCESAWAFAISDVFSDRVCIERSITNFTGSVQQLISCDYSNQGCKSGNELKAFYYITQNGLVSETCYPYINGNGGEYYCELDTVNECKTRYFGKNIKSFNNIEKIIKEVKVFGPVASELIVYADFMAYKSGIYVPTSTEKLGVHAVKIVGYGNQGGIDYWTVANSWGSSWGEEGYFRIKMGTNCSIESQVVSIQAKYCCRSDTADFAVLLLLVILFL